MLRLAPLMFVVSILFVGCTAPAHLMHTSEPTRDEKMQQTIAVWKGKHISKAIQKWGSPTEVSDDGTGWQTCIWEIPVHGFLAKQESRARGFQFRQDHEIHPQRRLVVCGQSVEHIYQPIIPINSHFIHDQTVQSPKLTSKRIMTPQANLNGSSGI